MEMMEFHNGLRLLRSIDKYEIDAELPSVAPLSEKAWTTFRDDPYMRFIQMDDMTRGAVWRAMEKRTR